ncbi:hypothetical protein PAEPH01_0341 [Pancytospora epiphaga]|nr:hypothetical protein PAEPH01_0341 [Pancytospora epiphaga]
MEIGKDSLRTSIAASLKHSLKSTLNISSESIPEHKIFYQRQLLLGSGSPIFKELKLKADEFYASNKFLIAFKDGLLFIYKYNNDLQFKLCKKIEICYLLYKRRSLSRKIRHFVYKIYIDLIESGVYRYDAWFEAIFSYLDLDQIENVIEYENGFILVGLDKSIRYFDSYLNSVSYSDLVPLKPVLGNDEQYVVVGKKSIKLFRTESTYISRHRLGNILQYVPVNNLLFLLLDSKLIVVTYK